MKKSRTINNLSTMAEKVSYDSSKDIERGELFLFIGENPIAFASSCGLDISTEEIDISNKMCGSWAASLPGKKSFTISCESLLTRKTGAMSFDTLLENMIDGKTLKFFFGGTSKEDARTNTGGEFTKDSTGQCYEGEVMITSLSLKSENGQIASCSASFKGIGALTQKIKSAPETPAT